MKERSEPLDAGASLRDKIVGLGERSLRKSYYPQLLQQLEDLKEARNSLAESQALYRALVENINDVIFSLDVKGVFTYVSPVVQSFSRMMPEQIIGKPFTAFVHPCDQSALVVFFDRVLSGLSERHEFRLLDNEGCVRYVSLSSRPLLEKERIVGLTGVMSDVTERRLAEEEIRRLNQELEQRVVERTTQLEAANRELEAFAYSVSHDLRAPLRHIDGFLGLLKDSIGSALDEQSQHYMETISKAAKRMGMLIDDLLSFSRMGRKDIATTQVNLRSLVMEVIRELEPEAKGRAIDWRIEDLPVVTGDRAMLRVVMVNLISNALKFTAPRAQTEIGIGYLHDHRAEMVIFVRDNGVGFDMQYASKLFGVFERLHSVEEFEGTGIGLANVRRVITRHGGRTWAEGKIDGGATFYFSLPCSASKELVQEHSEAP